VIKQTLSLAVGSLSSGQNRQKNCLKECVLRLFGTQNTVPYCQKHTLTDCSFGYFAHWVTIKRCAIITW